MLGQVTKIKMEYDGLIGSEEAYRYIKDKQEHKRLTEMLKKEGISESLADMRVIKKFAQNEVDQFVDITDEEFIKDYISTQPDPKLVEHYRKLARKDAVERLVGVTTDPDYFITWISGNQNTAEIAGKGVTAILRSAPEANVLEDSFGYKAFIEDRIAAVEISNETLRKEKYFDVVKMYHRTKRDQTNDPRIRERILKIFLDTYNIYNFAEAKKVISEARGNWKVERDAMKTRLEKIKDMVPERIYRIEQGHAKRAETAVECYDYLYAQLHRLKDDLF